MQRAAKTVVGLWVLSLAWNQWRRRAYYEQAVQRARAIGRPLIVIGDPKKGMSSSLLGVMHGAGDVCIDLDPVSDECYRADATAYLRTLQSDSAVIYTSCVLEYVPAIDDLIGELNRVSGGPLNLFVVNLQWWTPSAYLYSFQGDTSHNVILAAPPSSDHISYFRLR